MDSLPSLPARDGHACVPPDDSSSSSTSSASKKHRRKDSRERSNGSRKDSRGDHRHRERSSKPRKSMEQRNKSSDKPRRKSSKPDARERSRNGGKRRGTSSSKKSSGRPSSSSTRESSGARVDVRNLVSIWETIACDNAPEDDDGEEMKAPNSARGRSSKSRNHRKGSKSDEKHGGSNPSLSSPSPSSRRRGRGVDGRSSGRASRRATRSQSGEDAPPPPSSSTLPQLDGDDAPSPSTTTTAAAAASSSSTKGSLRRGAPKSPVISVHPSTPQATRRRRKDDPARRDGSRKHKRRVSWDRSSAAAAGGGHAAAAAMALNRGSSRGGRGRNSSVGNAEDHMRILRGSALTASSEKLELALSSSGGSLGGSSRKGSGKLRGSHKASRKSSTKGSNSPSQRRNKGELVLPRGSSCDDRALLVGRSSSLLAQSPSRGGEAPGAESSGAVVLAEADYVPPSSSHWHESPTPSSSPDAAPPLCSPSSSSTWHVERGGEDIAIGWPGSPSGGVALEDHGNFSKLYRMHCYLREHENFWAVADGLGPIIISVQADGLLDPAEKEKSSLFSTPKRPSLKPKWAKTPDLVAHRRSGSSSPAPSPSSTASAPSPSSTSSAGMVASPAGAPSSLLHSSSLKAEADSMMASNKADATDPSVMPAPLPASLKSLGHSSPLPSKSVSSPIMGADGTTAAGGGAAAATASGGAGDVSCSPKAGGKRRKASEASKLVARVIVRTKNGTTQLFIRTLPGLKELKRTLKVALPQSKQLGCNPELGKMKLHTFSKTPEGHSTMEDALLALEDKIVRPMYKFGVLYVKMLPCKGEDGGSDGKECDDDDEDEQDGRSAHDELPEMNHRMQTENEMFQNNDASRDFYAFLDLLGDRVTLKGFEHYRGGLDVKEDATGTHSYYTKYSDTEEIMFHVSPMLPFFPADEQQVERKRHLGNDIVGIVFIDDAQLADGQPRPSWDPDIMTNQFNHVFAVVSKLRHAQGDKYRIEVATKVGVRPYAPRLPSPCIVDASGLRDFLLTKLINGERATLHSPEFRSKLRHTRLTHMKAVMPDGAK